MTAPLRASRRAVLAAAARPDEVVDDGLDVGTVRVVGAPSVHLDVVRARAGELRRAEAWVSPDGVVALAHREDDEVEGTLVSLPPVAAHQVCVSALGLDPGVPAAAVARDAPAGFSALARDVFEGDRLDLAVTVVDWHVGDVLRRWVVLDAAGGRVAHLAAPATGDAPLTLVPRGPMALAVALARIVAQATAPTTEAG